MQKSNTPTAPEILAKAAGHIADRADTYDKPQGERSIGLTVQLFNLLRGHDLTEAEGWEFMSLLKKVRGWHAPGYHGDSHEDEAAFVALKAESKARDAVQPAQESAAVEWEEFQGDGRKICKGWEFLVSRGWVNLDGNIGETTATNCRYRRPKIAVQSVDPAVEWEEFTCQGTEGPMDGLQMRLDDGNWYQLTERSTPKITNTRYRRPKTT